MMQRQPSRGLLPAPECNMAVRCSCNRRILLQHKSFVDPSVGQRDKRTTHSGHCSAAILLLGRPERRCIIHWNARAPNLSRARSGRASEFASSGQSLEIRSICFARLFREREVSRPTSSNFCLSLTRANIAARSSVCYTFGRCLRRAVGWPAGRISSSNSGDNRKWSNRSAGCLFARRATGLRRRLSSDRSSVHDGHH